MGLLNAKSFQSIRFEFGVHNSTSKMDVPRTEKISLIELAPEGLTLALPPRSCASGHFLKVRIEISQENLKQVFEATAIVEEVKSAPQSEDWVKVKLVQFDSAIWTKVLKQIQSEGDQVSNLFQQMKGRK
jgi:hypothetical protein